MLKRCRRILEKYVNGGGGGGKQLQKKQKSEKFYFDFLYLQFKSLK